MEVFIELYSIYETQTFCFLYMLDYCFSFCFLLLKSTVAAINHSPEVNRLVQFTAKLYPRVQEASFQTW